MNTNHETIQTRNRKMELFFHMHGVSFIRQYKDVDGMNVWVYDATPENLRIREEYLVGQRRLNEKKGA